MMNRWLRTAFAAALGVGAMASGAKAQVVPTAGGYPTFQVPGAGQPTLNNPTGVREFQPVQGSTYESNSDTSHIWFTGEYLLWRVKNRSVAIPLATTGTPGTFGIIGEAGTTVVPGLGDNEYNKFSSGMKLGIGFWYDDSHAVGAAANIWWMFGQNVGSRIASDATGNPTVSRPFFDTFIGAENARVLAFNAGNIGSVGTDSFIRMWGAEIDPYVCQIGGDGVTSTYLRTGFKYWYMNEALTVADSSTAINGGTVSYRNGNFPAGFSTSAVDSVTAANRFYGANFGLNWHGEFMERLTLDLAGNIAVGGTQEVVDVYGYSTLRGPNGRVVSNSQGGLLALSSNSGKFSKYVLSVLPEFNFSLGFKVTTGVQLHVGYNIMYVSSAVRAADQLAYRRANPTLMPTSPGGVFGAAGGGANPPRYLDRTDFTAQSLGIGLTLSY